MSWGVLGDKPTANQITEWQNMPFGEFKKMVTDLSKKSKGKSLKRHTVQIKNTISEYKLAYIDVQAYDIDHAVTLAKDAKSLDWSDKKPEADKYTYRVSQVWV